VADHRPGTPGRHGRDPSAVTLAEVRIAHAWNVMGRAAPGIARDTLGVGLPVVPNTTAGSDPAAVWIGPASWLVTSAPAIIKKNVAQATKIANRLRPRFISY